MIETDCFAAGHLHSDAIRRVTGKTFSTTRYTPITKRVGAKSSSRVARTLLFGVIVSSAFAQQMQGQQNNASEGSRSEAQLIVDSLNVRVAGKGGSRLPLKSELLSAIAADQKLTDEARSAAVRLVNSLRREKELETAARKLVFTAAQPQDAYELAIRYATEIFETDANNARVWSLRALALYRLRKFDEAQTALTRARELDAANRLPVSAEDLTLQAMLGFQSGERDKAIKTYQLSRRAACRDEVDCQLLMAEAEGLLNIPSAGDESELWIGRQVMPRSNGDLGTMPRTVTMVVGNHLLLDLSPIPRSQVIALNDALDYYSQVIKRDPKNATAYSLRGITHRHFASFDKAIADYTSASLLRPTEPAYVHNRALIRIDDKQEYVKALVDLEAALKLDANRPEFHGDHARTLAKLNRLDEALVSYGEAIRLDPQDSWYYVNRAELWSAKKLRVKMIADFEDAIRLSPDDSYAYSIRAWALATSPHAEIRDGKQAVVDGTKACELSAWEDYNSLENLAAAYAESGDFDKAVKWQEKAVSLTPPSERSEFESHLKLFRKGKPFRDTRYASGD